MLTLTDQIARRPVTGPNVTHLTRLLLHFVRLPPIPYATDMPALTEKHRKGLNQATSLVRMVCRVAGQPSLIDELTEEFRAYGIVDAVRRHDDAALYEHLVAAISFQGVADAVAASYLEEHGSVGFREVERALLASPECPKLLSYWQFRHCGYRKTAATCAEPDKLWHCPLPKHDLRNGNLNQAAYSLYLFMRDVAGGDFVQWLDRQLEHADIPKACDRGRRLSQSVVEPLRRVHGISDKVLNMTLASLLLAGDPARERWVMAGGSMIAIDSLVHNWLHRTGILRAMGSGHLYGPACYGADGCASIVERIAKRIDASAYNPNFPKSFPRFVQKAIWEFCAQSGLDQCNGNQIDDRRRCKLSECYLYERCDRVRLLPSTKRDHQTVRT
jgi:hypothetical protein